MRQIKFRGKRPNSGKWITGSLIQLFGFSYIVNDEHKNADCSTEVLPDTVSQFTGLVDRNGKEIYEGDVLETEQGIAYVIWNDAAFALKSPGSNAVDWEHSSVYEKSIVIGSIHDSPELLDC